GAPTRIVNAYGDSTVVRRTDPRFPLLPTSVTQPNGFETQASYNARGLTDMVTALRPLGTTENAVTRYSWNSAWDMVDSVVAPTGERTRFHYDAAGNRDWQEDGRGSISRTSFSYD